MGKIDKKKFRILYVMILLIFSLNFYPNDPLKKVSSHRKESNSGVERQLLSYIKFHFFDSISLLPTHNENRISYE